jgi:hypothetical protein
MILSIDYDDTYTRDPLFWNWVAQEAMDRGHTVWCVSARHQTHMEEPVQTIGRIIGEDKCVGTNGVAKRDYLFKHKGVYADVWVDDMPDTVVTGYDIGDDPGWVTQYDGGLLL